MLYLAKFKLPVTAQATLLNFSVTEDGPFPPKLKAAF